MITDQNIRIDCHFTASLSEHFINEHDYGFKFDKIKKIVYIDQISTKNSKKN